MLKKYQQTLASSISFQGIGLHSGLKTKIKIKPGIEDQGIVFKRTDLKKNNLVIANYQNVSSARLCTTLKNKYGVKVSTVEHLLAALYICEIDNAEIEVNAEEIPIMDGSALDFIRELENVNIKILNKKRKYLRINKKIQFKDNEKTISIEPSDLSFQVDFQLNYKNNLIGNQKNSINFTYDNLEDVYSARTFCLFEDIEKIKKLGLAKGGSLDNALVVKNEKVLNEGGLRNDKEFVNHKILDLAGDFILSGQRILGKVICYQGGHELSNKFLRNFLNLASNFDTLEIKDVLFSNKKNTTQKIAVNA